MEPQCKTRAVGPIFGSEPLTGTGLNHEIEKVNIKTKRKQFEWHKENPRYRFEPMVPALHTEVSIS